MRRPRHGRQHRCKPGVTAKHFENHEALVRSGAGSQAVRHGNGARHSGAETDAVVGAGNIVVHGLRNGDHLHALLIQAYAVAQRVIPANGDEIVDAKPAQIFQHFRGQVVRLGAINRLEVSRNAGLLHLAWIGSRGVQERTAGAACAVDQIFRQRLKVLAVVVIFFANDVDQPGPPPANANHLAALAHCADGYGADSRVQARNVAAASENSDYTFLCFHV